MIRIEMDGWSYDFDSYDELEVDLGILEDILAKRTRCQLVPTVDVVCKMRKVLAGGRSRPI